MSVHVQWSTTRTEFEAASAAAALFESEFQAPPVGVWAAPGRVNLIGEHVDYAGGVCLPFALTQCTFVAASPRDDGAISVVSNVKDKDGTDVTHRDTISLSEVGPNNPASWLGYIAGTVWAMVDDGILPHNSGFNFAFVSDVPLGAGLSSSAAIECSTAVAAAELSNLTVDDALRKRLVDCCIRAENEVVGASTGGLDQKISLFGHRDSALALDFTDATETVIPCNFNNHGLAILVINTNAPHSLADGQYASRRRVIDGVADVAGASTLREVSNVDESTLVWAEANVPPDVSHDDWLDTVKRRVGHVTSEVARTLEAIENLKVNDFEAFGQRMCESHVSLRDDYEVSCQELDIAVDTAMAHGALGARMTGGGFGGSAIALLDVQSAESVAASIAEAFADAGLRAPEFLMAVPSAGARKVP